MLEQNGHATENLTSEQLLKDVEKEASKKEEPELESNQVQVQALQPDALEDVPLEEQTEVNQDAKETLINETDDSSLQNKNLIKESLSVEFTYTSLDDVKSDSDEQQVEDAAVNIGQGVETIETKQISQKLDSIDSQLNNSSINGLETVSSLIC